MNKSNITFDVARSNSCLLKSAQILSIAQPNVGPRSSELLF